MHRMRQRTIFPPKISFQRQCSLGGVCHRAACLSARRSFLPTTMSNKVVPNIYRAVIDDVINALKPEFEDYGVDDSILELLQHKWESKMIASRVADFSNATEGLTATSQKPQQPQIPVLAAPHYPTYIPPNAASQGRVQTQPIKPEPLDARFGTPQYQLPPLPGPTLPSHLAFPSAIPHLQHPVGHPVQGQQMYRINQVDGPSASSDEEDYDEEVPIGPPRPAHPSVSVPAPSKSNISEEVDPEAITSDLDDSDTENEEDKEDANAVVTDVVFCTYDKVARVKNKWKCVLKDGMIHTGGKDFLFARCTGEFEW
ncbi:Transcriptional factor IIA alpha/beta subunit [Mycena indigotica]|uniref:Transcriptional factor IIA alpha/beta subunit n=1 Tax=Mycena indigotica TaxID=2126181 RepID=A0A8H6S0R2_9AGAR|nr:Transcriptional factor IIA alpha/beta subunit [Mycena indigotica]KAF7289916.1 Transcriptional factor IIA alpha/beta subunit [Mycena indigotica]